MSPKPKPQPKLPKSTFLALVPAADYVKTNLCKALASSTNRTIHVKAGGNPGHLLHKLDETESRR